VNLDTALALAGIVAEAVILGLLIFRRVFKTLPLFSFWLAWSLINDIGQYFSARHFPQAELQIYLISSIVDSIFMFCVLIEVSMSVLKPMRGLLPRWAILAVGMLFAVASGAVWMLVKFPGFDKLTGSYQVIVHISLTSSIIRIVFFLLLAGFSQLLSIGWRDREFQIATGFGFYAVASLSVTLLHLNLGVNPALVDQYHLFDQLLSASYVCSIGYWIISFAQKVPERREFTPQMQHFLVALAGNARSTRLAMDDKSAIQSDRNRRN
jgi:hypothetical protein